MVRTMRGELQPIIPPGPLLVPVANSPRLVALIAEGMRLARALEREAVFLHVGADAGDRSAVVTAVAKAGAAVPRVVERGKIERVICKVAREIGAALIVAGALEQESRLSYYVGSVARRLARTAPCPVLLLAAPRSDPQPFSRPLVAIGNLDRSSPIVAFALALAAAERAEDLHVLRECEVHGYHLAAAAEAVEDASVYLDQLQAQEELALAEFLSRWSPSVPMRRWCMVGKAGHEAAQHARAHERDLLIVAQPDRWTGLWGKLFRSGSEVALRDLPCALLLHRASDRRSGRQRKTTVR